MKLYYYLLLVKYRSLSNNSIMDDYNWFLNLYNIKDEFISDNLESNN